MTCTKNTSLSKVSRKFGPHSIPQKYNFDNSMESHTHKYCQGISRFAFPGGGDKIFVKLIYS